MADSAVKAVDLFCGAGGLAYGLEQAGIDVVAGYDLDSDCRHAYEANTAGTFHERNVAKVTAKDLRTHFGDAPSLLAGCAPCQPFSLINPNRMTQTDQRWGLLGHFARLVNAAHPDFVTMENVPGLEKTPVFQGFIEVLNHRGYAVVHDVIHCSDVGVPQKRQRLVLIASRHGHVRLPRKNPGPSPTVGGAIRGLPKLDAGGEDAADPLHRAANLSDQNLARIRASKPGGTWKDWPSHLRLKCQEKESGASFVEPYGRMAWNTPGPTITTKFYNLGSGRFGHPDQDRALSLREGALLQTFPKDYEFFAEDKPLPLTTVGRLIGNAVPVALGQAVGSVVAEMAAQIA